MGDNDTGLTTSDEALVANARSGDQGAFAELWRRHYRSGARVARQFTSSIDADDLVAEAYTRIYQRVVAGGGPSGAFRPYLYTTIRNLASTWGAASRDVQVDDIQDFEDPSTIEDPVAIALDRTLTARAFRALPERWQSVLWYTEVEGMDPHEVAPILGMSANGVAALSYRAREGLRKAWLQAHVSQVGISDACKWTIARIGDKARNSLTTRESERVREHLATCTKCSIISEEVDEVGSHLAMVMIPLLLGGVVGGALLATAGHAAATVAASAVPPAVPASFAVLGGATSVAPAVASGLAATSGVTALVGSLAVAATITGTIALGLTPRPTLADVRPRVVAAAPLVSTPTPSPASQTPGVGATNGAVPVTGATGAVTNGVGNTVSSLVGGVGKAVGNTVGSAVPGAVTSLGSAASKAAPATVTLSLSGKGSPGAALTVGAGSTVLANTTVGPDGTWSVMITGLAPTITSVHVEQVLVSLFGINLLTVPLSLSGNSLGIAVTVLG